MLVCVTYSLEADGSGDGIKDLVCMRKVREPSSLNALEVHCLKTKTQALITSMQYLRGE